MEEIFTRAVDILYLAKKKGVDILLNGDQLQLKVSENRPIDEELLEEIRANKKGIIDFLSNEDWKLTIVSNNNHEINSFNRDVVKHVPLSFSQERLWFIDRLEGSLKYHLPVVLRLKGNLDHAALSKALAEVVNRHEILRTVYEEENGRVYQHVKVAGNWQLGESDGRKYGGAQKELESYIQALIMEPFDLGKDDMFRAELIRMDAGDHILVVVMHHIASDASSTPVLVGEVAALYRGYASGEAAQLPILSLQYADYAVWQRDHVRGSFLEEKLSYWKQQLEDVSPLQLSADYARPAGGSSRGSTVSFEIGGELGRQVQALGHQQGATLYMTLLAAFKVLLYRYCGQEDICVGTSVAGRPQRELKGLIGFFVNTLALRSGVRGNMNFTELLQEVKRTTLEAYEHQEVPFEKVVEAVAKDRQVGLGPLFQVMLVLDNTREVPNVKLGELTLSEQRYEQTTTKFDLTFFIKETKGSFKGTIQYNADLYSAERIGRMASHFQELLGSIVSTPEERVGSLGMLGIPEREELLVYGLSRSSCLMEATVADLFEAQAARNPEAVAVVFEEEELTYKELNERANRLAHELQGLGVKAGTLVPLYTERGLAMLTGILGILKAGGAYVPIDTGFPEERIRYMLEDTGASVAVGSGGYADHLQSLRGDNIQVIDLDKPGEGAATGNPARSQQAEDLAYVIYTSGSTGQPKGVEISHGNVLDYVYGLEERTGISACKSFALVSTIATDLGNTVLYSSLVFGGTLHVFSKETVSHIEALHEYFKAHKIDCLKIVPSHWKVLSPEDGAPLLPRRMLFFGGEALPTESVARIRSYSTDCRIFNHYGPTETTIGKLLYELKEGDEGKVVPIGKPFSNTRAYVLSKDMGLCPVGVPGQLYIAGDGVAKGYLNRPELTAEKFIQDPNAKQGERMYATGDRAAYRGDGNIVFIGRVDDQVKIRGYRVEPGEVGRVLETSGLVEQAVVIARENKQGNMQLIGYVVPRGSFDEAGIRSWLKAALPDYMVPSHIVALESLPLTANGKVDRKALPDPEGIVAEAGYIAPRNETEQVMAEIWQEVLEVDKVGITDDFFELGGHSLLAVRLVSKIRKALERELPVSDVFDYPTVGQLAARLSGEQAELLLPPVMAVVPRPAHIPLSFSQERLWFIDRLEGSVQYHIPAVLRLQGSLVPKILEQTLQAIINRHEVLRTVIRDDEEGHGYQHIMSADGWSLGITEGLTGGEVGLSSYIESLIRKPFDLSADYMLRADLIKLGEQEHSLIVTMHHIASDAWSRSILVKEVTAIYEGYASGQPAILAPLQVQYADYSIWQRKYVQGEVLEEKLGYWKSKLEGVAPLQLPLDYARPAIQSSRGATCSFRISHELMAQLTSLSHQHGATLYMTLLAAFKVLLFRYSGQEDICVGTPVAGRNQQELEELIGFFINTLALRGWVRAEMTFIDLLQEVKGTTLEAYSHQEVPFEKVVDAVVKERDMSRNPLFQVLFSLQNTPEVPDLKLGDLSLSSESQDRTTSKFDIAFMLNETSIGIHGTIEYSTVLFKEETIARMVSHYINLLDSVVASPGNKIGSLAMLGATEEEILLKLLNNTGVNYPKGKTIIDLFEEQVVKAPEAIALVFEGEQLSYKELNERSNQLAHYLQKRGINAGTLVPICIERGTGMLIGILGILKAGGAYVPIDPAYPRDRISYMLEDTAAKLVLSSKAARGKLTTGAAIIEIDGDWDKIKNGRNSNLGTNIIAEQLAYVIYTSGSTGKPKGVMIEHGNVYSFISWCGEEFAAERFNMVYACTSICFDLSVFEIFYPLIAGKQLRVLENGLAIGDYLAGDSLVMINTVPSVVAHLIDEKTDLSHASVINMAGEPVPLGVLEGLDTKKTAVRNLYGPTEDTTYSTISVLENGKPITIGKPIWNTKIYIVNTDQALNPIGVTGEILIGGTGLARGYLNQPELTKEKFINDPFSGEAGARLYRTGDIGRWLPDGNIEYQGRKDDQVKVRGYRIELGEIESILNGMEEVRQGVVLAKEDNNGNKRLIGYVVPAAEFDKLKVGTYLSTKLPEYMVPSLWVVLERMPLTPNGKTDRKVLPDPDMKATTATYTPPRSQMEARLSQIWRGLLGVERVGIYDNFFELGGNSLLAMRLVSYIKRDLHLELSIRDLFVHPTTAELAAYLKTESKKKLRSLVPIKSSGNKPPLYIICGAGGTVFKFREFANLLDHEQPVYGLQQFADSEDVENFPDTIEGIAARYIEEILLENTEGPYALSGHCFGGIIALEMANQFEAMGKKVSLLAMFDTNIRERKEVIPASMNNFYHIPAIIKRTFSKILIRVKFQLFLLTKHPKQALFI